MFAATRLLRLFPTQMQTSYFATVHLFCAFRHPLTDYKPRENACSDEDDPTASNLGDCVLLDSLMTPDRNRLVHLAESYGKAVATTFTTTNFSGLTSVRERMH